MASNFDSSVLVTGGTVGLGYQCALAIARQHPNYQVVVASRSDLNASANAINEILDQENVLFMKLDLSSFSGVRSFVAEWELKKFPPIQSLVFNAALQLSGPLEYSVDGIEKTFAISHVGHALLFSLLRSHLADTARIVIVSSGTHDPAQKTGLPDAKYRSAEELAHPPAALARANGRQHYTNTKLANVLYGYALHRRFQTIQKKSGKHWTVTVMDPGLMPGTGIFRDANPVFRFLWVWLVPRILPVLRFLLTPNINTPEESGAALARLAVGSDVEGASGMYFEGRKKIKSSQLSYDEAKQEDLWEWTVDSLAINQEERSAFALLDLV
ncbi:hypothetical protein N7462_005408 [Penicillium macrosclerotiorum]|uniref:uncharacterized protein n=1 Tax=Penicillium macrosclerotiorum TaxID=303699 RepID=UPI0025497FBF|nr:uncharacterized protein N7462_005408 [Penicillium macrosclerotiorum]KAJ5682243.1 hypothetical protein N7462_005408 [Penicillium macrosclerotiorum]